MNQAKIVLAAVAVVFGNAAVAAGNAGGGTFAVAGVSPARATDVARFGAAASVAVDPADAANQLMDYGESVFPNYFPSRRSTLNFPPYLYRYYPETGTYLGVANGRVYVLGGVFGAEVVDVGLLTDYVTPVAGPSVASRISAASATARSTTNTCSELPSFYWEVGDTSARLAGESINRGTGTSITASSVISIASASKWLYGAYVAEKRSGNLTATDIKFMTFRSGYMNFSALPICQRDDTVASCLTHGTNGDYTAANDGLFYYDSGHMQQHAGRAELGGLGPLDEVGLGAEIRSLLGTDINLSYIQPHLAGGAWTSANDYATFLRKILSRRLKIAGLLGTNAVCTNPGVCPGLAVYTPIPSSESWHYSIGHWVEDDPIVGDGSFSSLGAFGFYPWVDSSLRFYGIVARNVPTGAVGSAQCGRLIRKAWMSGTAQ